MPDHALSNPSGGAQPNHAPSRRGSRHIHHNTAMTMKAETMT
jgi:hypothetical protein